MLCRRANLHLSLGHHHRAVNDARRCIRLRPDYLPGYFVKGCGQYAMLKLDKALAAFRAGLDRCPGHPKLLFAFNAVMRNVKRSGVCFVSDVREAPGRDAPDAAFEYADEEAADEEEAAERAATAPLTYPLRAGLYRAGGGRLASR